MANSHSHSQPTILTLPTELQLQISSHLSTPSLQLLRLTSRHYQHLLAPPTDDDLEEIALSIYNRRQDWACTGPSSCHRLYRRYPSLPWKPWPRPWDLRRKSRNQGHRGREFQCEICNVGCVEEVGGGYAAHPITSLFHPRDYEGIWARMSRERGEIRALRRRQGLDPCRWDFAPPLIPPGKLLALPPEIQCRIITHLSATELQLLRLSCRHFYAVPHPLPAFALLLDIEKSPYNVRRFKICHGCKKLLPFRNWRRVEGTRELYWFGENGQPEGDFVCQACGFVNRGFGLKMRGWDR